MNITEELLELVSLKDTTTGRDNKDAVINCAQSRQIDLKNLVGIATDGVPSMVGKNVGAVSLIFDHTKALGNSSSDFEIKTAPQQLPVTIPKEAMAPIAVLDETPPPTPPASSTTTPQTPPTPPFNGTQSRVLPEKQQQELHQLSAAMLQRQLKQQPQAAAAMAPVPEPTPGGPGGVPMHPSQSVPNVMAYLKLGANEVVVILRVARVSQQLHGAASKQSRPSSQLHGAVSNIQTRHNTAAKPAWWSLRPEHPPEGKILSMLNTCITLPIL
ncbi:hypothetical protein TNCV_30721 [Trichonephila clavipes]|nr:hypothetical protein TNCV_30721 [Trichonephila clavipes]